MVSELQKDNSFDPNSSTMTTPFSAASSSSSASPSMTILPAAPSPITTTFTLPSVTQHISTKLDSPADYLNWVSHFNPILNAHDLMGFVDGTEPCPPQYITDEAGQATTVINPAYSLWQKKDQCLLSWFNTTLSDRVLSSLYGLKTARQVWTTLATRYANQSKARICYLKRSLQTLNQGSKSCSEFLSETKSYSDLLAAAGQPVEDEDLISYILGGLNPAYITFITLFNFTTRTTSMTFEEFQTELLNHEILLGNHQQLQQPSTELGNFALYSQKPKSSTENFQRGRPAAYPKNSHPSAPPRNYSRNGYQSNFRRSGGNQTYGGHHNQHSKSLLGPPPTHASFNRTPCQICGKSGHQALDCFHRMDYSYQGKNPPSQLAALVARTHPATAASNEEDPWYADSGANNHVTAALDNLTLQEPFKGDDEVAVGNGTGLAISNIGSSVLYNSKSPFQQPFKLNHILHCPAAAANLLSIHKFCVDNKCWFILTDSNFFVKDNLTGQTLLQGPSKDGLYPIQFSKSVNKVKKFAAFLGVSASSRTWHSRLGHPAPPIFNKIKHLAKLPITSSSSPESLCEPCLLAKSKCLPFSASNNVTREPLEIIHSDLWSSPIPSINGCHYYVVFIDNHSRFTWIYPLHHKSETFACFVKFKSLVENLLSKKIKSFQSDGGGEFTSNQFKQYLSSNGILHRVSCPYTAAQNGLAERKHRHIVETGLALLAHSHLPLSYWVDAFTTAVYLINRLPTSVLQHQSPYVKLLHKNPDYTFLKVFGCACFPLLRPYNSHKMMYRSKKCIFLGYCSNYKGYRCYDPTSKRTIISRHVVFDENTFPAKDWISSQPVPSATDSAPFQVSPSTMVSATLNLHPVTPATNTISSSVIQTESPTPESEPTSPSQPAIGSSAAAISPSSSLSTPSPTFDSNPLANHSIPTNLHTDTESIGSPAPAPTSIPHHHMTTRLQAGTQKPKSFPNYKLYFSTKHPLMALHSKLTNSELPPTPTKYSQAVQFPHWQQAMQDEFTALQANQTWTLCPRPPHKNIITNKWVYKVKQKADGTLTDSKLD
jgi:hypothetical protein